MAAKIAFEAGASTVTAIRGEWYQGIPDAIIFETPTGRDIEKANTAFMRTIGQRAADQTKGEPFTNKRRTLWFRQKANNERS